MGLMLTIHSRVTPPWASWASREVPDPLLFLCLAPTASPLPPYEVAKQPPVRGVSKSCQVYYFLP